MRHPSHLAALAGLSVALPLLVPAGAQTDPLPAAPSVTPVRTRLGTSSMGSELEVWTLAAPGNDPFGRGPDQRPAILIIAGLQGHHTVGVSTAEAVARNLAQDHAELLAAHTVYVIPNASPDSGVWLMGNAATARIESGRIPTSGDADRDGRVDEDWAEDLNGDGMITQMRIRNPDARWGLRATLVPNPDEPRLMREAKPIDGEVGQWAVLQEGADNDGDGRFNEDGGGGASGGIDLAMNFPTHYPEHDDGAGRYPLSSPEGVAIVRWAQAHRNIVAVVVYDPHDNMVNIPATGQFGPEGSVPRGLEEADKPYHQHVADAFKEATHMTGAPTGRTAGSFASWAYGDLGVWTFSTPVWVRPDQIKSDQGGQEATPDGGGPGEGRGQGDPKAAERAALIAEGFPARVADFLIASPAERQAIMAQVESMTEAERQAMMAEVMALTPAQQQRVMEAVGVRGGRPPGGPPAGGPPVHHHDDEEQAPAPSFELQTIAQPAGGPPPGAQPVGGGRRFGGGGAPPGGAGGGGGGGARSGEAPSGEDAKWLAYSDDQRDRTGFVEWTAFEHPQLGPVEIGGFVPGFRVNPPEGELERLATEQTDFITRLLPMLPDVVLDAVEGERVAGDLWRVRAVVSNPGFLPTSSAIGQKARRLTPIVLQISTDPTRILSGQRVRRFESIDGSGARRDAEWLVRGSPGEQVTIDLRSDVFGTRSQTITLSTGEAGR